jgi:hypothetical protein
MFGAALTLVKGHHFSLASFSKITATPFSFGVVAPGGRDASRALHISGRLVSGLHVGDHAQIQVQLEADPESLEESLEEGENFEHFALLSVSGSGLSGHVAGIGFHDDNKDGEQLLTLVFAFVSHEVGQSKRHAVKHGVDFVSVENHVDFNG